MLYYCECSCLSIDIFVLEWIIESSWCTIKGRNPNLKFVDPECNFNQGVFVSRINERSSQNYSNNTTLSGLKYFGIM